MSEAIEGLKPELLWRYFAEVASIPRPSKHEERIGAYVLETARELGLQAAQDGCGNIVVRKPASPGREKVRSICLQAHLDMVCEKNAGTSHDFLTDPIRLVCKGGVLMADGTTLGADNGIGVAANLAVMADRSMMHGPLELLFTVDEETGLTGAKNLDPSLIESRTLLNLDSEEEGTLYVGCAGGKDTLGKWDVVREDAPSPGRVVHLTVKGLKGGHSGLDIDKGRGDAIIILNRAVLRLAGLGARLVAVNGGNMRNAIPREAEATLFIPREKLAAAQALVPELESLFRAEAASVEPDLAVRLTEQAETETVSVFTEELQRNLCRTLSALPHGFLGMSADIPGLVETSTNVAIIATREHTVELATSQRSSVASRLTEAVEAVTAAFELGGARVETSGGYPGWTPNLASPILKVARECHRSLFGREAEVTAIHAGLECGLLGEHIPGLDMVSFGPTLEGVHSPDEKIHIDTVERFWDFLRAILTAAE
jgi:dipeptidase D